MSAAPSLRSLAVFVGQVTDLPEPITVRWCRHDEPLITVQVRAGELPAWASQMDRASTHDEPPTAEVAHAHRHVVGVLGGHRVRVVAVLPGEAGGEQA
jgi:hypothetical protein